MKQNVDALYNVHPCLAQLCEAVLKLPDWILRSDLQCHQATPDDPQKVFWNVLRWYHLGIELALDRTKAVSLDIQQSFRAAIQWALTPEDPDVLAEQRRLPWQLEEGADTDDEFMYPGSTPNTVCTEVHKATSKRLKLTMIAYGEHGGLRFPRGLDQAEDQVRECSPWSG
jgi:hypothetical protein